MASPDEQRPERRAAHPAPPRGRRLMARTRSIWPEFFTTAELAQLSPLHRVLYAGLPTVADWEGRGDDKPADLKIRLLALDLVDVAGVDGLLSDLELTGLIERYQVEGKRYFEINRDDWKRQHVHIDERKRPARPSKPEASTGPTPGQPEASTGAAALSLVSGLLSPVSDHQKIAPAEQQPSPSGDSEQVAGKSSKRRKPTPTEAEAAERRRVREFWDAGFRKRCPDAEPLDWGAERGKRHQMVLGLLKMCRGLEGALAHVERYFERYDSDAHHKGRGLSWQIAGSASCVEELRSARSAPNGSPQRRGFKPITDTVQRFEGVDDGDPLNFKEHSNG